MKFKFDVTINEKDYIDYNVFMLTKSPYGKQINTFRIILFVIPVIFIIISMLGGGSSVKSFVDVIPIIILIIVLQLFLGPFFSFSVKTSIRLMKKTGKMGYSPESILEFYEDYLVETGKNQKTEHKYSGVERISVIENKMIYIHVNNVMSYILPVSSFQSDEQYNNFIAFMKTKCANIDKY